MCLLIFQMEGFFLLLANKNYGHAVLPICEVRLEGRKNQKKQEVVIFTRACMKLTVRKFFLNLLRSALLATKDKCASERTQRGMCLNQNLPCWPLPPEK